MSKSVVFDIDGTLIHHGSGKPRLQIVALLRHYQDLGYSVQAWSGGGKEHVEKTLHRLGIKGIPAHAKPRIWPYKPDAVRRILGRMPDIQVDDNADEKLSNVQFVYTPDVNK
jgi:predicted HAD superfamily phosphohydrolase YqeG